MKGPLARICSFATESEMGENLISAIEPKVRFNQIIVKREFKAPQGVPDFLLFRRCGGAIVYVAALELKLKDWKKGLFQAFKYRSYCNAAYVVIDNYFRFEVVANIEEFISSNIGLATFSLDGDLEVLYEPKPDTPFSHYYSEVLDSSLRRQEPDLLKSFRFNRSRLGAVRLCELGAIHL